MKSCLIVGAGISGLLAGTQLQTAGWHVTILDKGRGVGGRMANRRMTADGSARADHGAQFFTVRDARFQAWVDEWMAADVVRIWTHGFSGRDGHPRYCGTTGMTAIAKHLAQNLTVHTRTKVSKIEFSDQLWWVITENGQLFESDALLLTSPAPQTLALLDAGQVALTESVRSALEGVRYNMCLAALVPLTAPSLLPAPGGIQARGEVIDWIGDNQQKGISAVPTLTIHGSADFSAAWFDRDPAEIAQRLIAEAVAKGWLDLGTVHQDGVQTHRWRYAQPATYHDARTLFTTSPGPLAFAGDAFLHARVEGAALSGLAAADALLEAMGER